MVYRVAVLDDMAAELRRTEEMLSAYGAAHPEQELETACFTRVKAFMDSMCRTETVCPKKGRYTDIRSGF